ncbi:MAG: serine hydrolase domain-containing protein [Nitrososphaeria archaeon]|jgi:CubicO group peptidase (beta-lactamase class C family)
MNSLPSLEIVENSEDLSIPSGRLEKAYEILLDAVKKGAVMGAAVQVGREARFLNPRVFGKRGLDPDSPAVEQDTIFLVASVTKPVVATAVMMLIERGELSLDDLVSKIVPEFSGRWKEKVLVRDLLTHTSGLPDMLPENRELRIRHASLNEFLEKIYTTPLLFEPETNLSYSSTGIAVLGEIVKRLSGKSLPEFLDKELFKPLGMSDTSLGIDWYKVDRVSQVYIKPDNPNGGPNDDYNWNSAYWRSLSTPWGGMFSTVSDLSKLLLMFLNEGKIGGQMIISPRTVKLMTSNQTNSMPHIPDDVKVSYSWGLGWTLKSPHNSWFGDLVSPATFGHLGATGCLAWADPEERLTCALLTNGSTEVYRLLSMFSNSLVASVF